VDNYNDFVQFARDCFRHAQKATTKQVAEELLQLAKQYQEKAAMLDGGRPPKLD
jgi:hypothetical protein